MKLALRRMGNMADAEDVFQSVFMRLHQNKERMNDEDHLKAWLLRTTMNCCYDILRKKKSSLPIEEARMVAEKEEATAQELDLHSAIDALPPAMQTVIHLFYFEGYATEEIAKITGEKPSTVRSHLHRARKALKISLKGVGNE